MAKRPKHTGFRMKSPFKLSVSPPPGYQAPTMACFAPPCPSPSGTPQQSPQVPQQVVQGQQMPSKGNQNFGGFNLGQMMQNLFMNKPQLTPPVKPPKPPRPKRPRRPKVSNTSDLAAEAAKAQAATQSYTPSSHHGGLMDFRGGGSGLVKRRKRRRNNRMRRQ